MYETIGEAVAFIIGWTTVISTVFFFIFSLLNWCRIVNILMYVLSYGYVNHILDMTEVVLGLHCMESSFKHFFHN